MEKLNLKYNEMVRVVNTGSTEIDGTYALVKGVASRHIIDMYILSVGDKPKVGPNGEKYTCFVMPESCIERV